MLDVLAKAALLGLDVEKMINGDPIEFGLRVRVVERASELRLDMDDNLATAIVNRLSQWMKA